MGNAHQQAMRLQLSRNNGESAHSHKLREQAFNTDLRKVSPAKIFCDTIKRLARRAMRDVTECDALALPAHLARLDDLREIIGHAIRHDYSETPEAVATEMPIRAAYTLADYAACIQHTRQCHRAPSFVNSRDGELSEINRKLDTIAGLLATNEQAQELFNKPGQTCLWAGGES